MATYKHIHDKYTAAKTRMERLIQSADAFQKKKKSLESTLNRPDLIKPEFLEGVLDCDSGSEMILQVFENIKAFNKANVHYFANQKLNHKDIILGNASKLMCEGLAKAVAEQVPIVLREIFKDWPHIMASLDAKVDARMSTVSFVTVKNLELLGKKRGYNIVREIDCKTGRETAVNHFFFKAHWQMRIGGKLYDTLFDLDPAAIVAFEVERNMK
ncbi:MAG: hypothetical protein AAFV80_23750, partial [Bacteroidota bacterium]